MEHGATDRYLKALSLRREGKTFKTIGELLGVGLNRARELVWKGERYERAIKEKEPWLGLSVRTRNCLTTAGIPDNVEAIRRAILDGTLKPVGLKNFGKKSFIDVCKWAGIDPESLVAQKVRSIPQKQIDYFIRTLESLGYTVTKER